MTLRIYGRTEHGEPLVELGSAEDGTDVVGSYPGDWIELVAFPETAIRWIIRDGEDVEDD